MEILHIAERTSKIKIEDINKYIENFNEGGGQYASCKFIYHNGYCDSGYLGSCSAFQMVEG